MSDARSAGPPVPGPVDVAVVGGGIVGLAVAWQLVAQRPELRIAVLEKESEVGRHQTGHSSGVLHSGVYYAPGSLKARTCQAGRAALLAFCDAEEIPVRLSGKVIVAVTGPEALRLEALAERGRANGVPCEVIGPGRLADLEPHVRGRAALHVPGAGVIDFGVVARRLAARLVEAGVVVATGSPVTGIRALSGTRVLSTPGGPVETRLIVTCPGLQADRVATMAGLTPSLRIVPFRGVFHRLGPDARRLCRALIYPVPDPALPFLGVHLTRTIDDEVTCGPGAVLALAREGYGPTDLDLGDLKDALAWPGTARLVARHLRAGLGETARAASRHVFARSVRRLVPEVRASDLFPAPHGIRAQAVDRAGRLVDDFVIEEGPGVIAILNAPSPAATAALAIGDVVAERVRSRLDGD